MKVSHIQGLDFLTSCAVYEDGFLLLRSEILSVRLVIRMLFACMQLCIHMCVSPCVCVHVCLIWTKCGRHSTPSTHTKGLLNYCQTST